MKALLCHGYGPPESLVLADVPPLRADAGKVVVAVEACGVNFPDTLIVQGRYQFQPPFPFSPGGEVAGTVKQVGEGVDHVRPGDRVIAVCGWGGFAEEVAVDAARVVTMPPSMDAVTASAFLLTYATSLYALADRGRLRAGESLLVLGAAGGVGLSAVECGKAMGARVIAAASSPEKLAVCREHGADDTIDYAAEDLRARLREIAPGGVDVVYDPVGGAYSEPALRSIAWDGRFLVIGFAAGDIPKVPLNLPLLKSCSIVGVFWGAWSMRDPAASRANIERLFRWHADGKLRPLVSATYPLEEAARALRDMMERRVTGKVVVLTR